LGLSGDPLSHQFGSYVAIIMTEVWKNTPYMALLLLAGLSQVSDELHEAARVDGASAWRRLRHVTLPQLRFIMLVLLLLQPQSEPEVALRVLPETVVVVVVFFVNVKLVDLLPLQPLLVHLVLLLVECGNSTPTTLLASKLVQFPS